MFIKKVLLSTVLAISFLGYQKDIEAQTHAYKLKVVNEKLEGKLQMFRRNLPPIMEIHC